MIWLAFTTVAGAGAALPMTTFGEPMPTFGPEMVMVAPAVAGCGAIEATDGGWMGKGTKFGVRTGSGADGDDVSSR